MKKRIVIFLCKTTIYFNKFYIRKIEKKIKRINDALVNNPYLSVRMYDKLENLKIELISDLKKAQSELEELENDLSKINHSSTYATTHHKTRKS